MRWIGKAVILIIILLLIDLCLFWKLKKLEEMINER